MADGIFGGLGSLFAPNIAGPITSGLTQGYGLAMPYLSQGVGAINQLYPQAQRAITESGGAATGTLQDLYNLFKPTARTYADATSGVTGPGSAWDMFSKSPFYTGGANEIQDILGAQAARSGRLGSGGEAVDLGKALGDYRSGQFSNWIQSLLPGVTGATGAATNLATTQGNIGTNLASSLQGQAGALQAPLTSQAELGWGLGTGTGAAGAQQGMLDAITGSQIFSGLLNLGGKVFSDERLKENVERVGETYDGLGVFKFTYVGDDTPRIGLVAQEVERKYPEAVSEVGGWKAVDYDVATKNAAALGPLFGHIVERQYSMAA